MAVTSDGWHLLGVRRAESSGGEVVAPCSVGTRTVAIFRVRHARGTDRLVQASPGADREAIHSGEATAMVTACGDVLSRGA